MLYATILENESLCAFLSVVVPIIVIVLIIILFLRFKKENKRYHAELASYIEGILTKREINAAISSYIVKDPTIEFTLIKVDIDKLDEISENLGKDEIEKIVKNIAFKMTEAVPKRVDIARIASDQFLVFVKGEYSRDEALDFANQFKYIVSTPYKIYSETSITLTASIGVAYYPAHGSNLKQLTDSLDIAVYTCKRDGGDKLAIYSPETGESESTNIEYYREIREGVKNKEFSLYYQPIIDCVNKKIFGFEGLMRWNHQSLGVLTPNKFLNIMEQSGEINWVAEWGMELLCQEAQEINKNGDYIMSLNLSTKQLLDESLSSKLVKVAKKYKMDMSKISLEIAEFTIYDRHEDIKKNIIALKEAGFKLAIDGIGLDFNGIKKLEEYKIDIVKLDKEYVNPDNEESLKSKFINLLIEYAKENNITIVAKCVENEFMLEHTLKSGLNVMQGFEFSVPLKEEEVTNYILNQSWNEHLNS